MRLTPDKFAELMRKLESERGEVDVTPAKPEVIETIKDVVDDTARGVEDAMVRAARELHRGYARIRKVVLKDPE